jgi:hypothetical protein
MTMLKSSLKTGRKSSLHQTNRIEDNKTAKTIDRRTTIGTTINSNGGQGLTTTPVQATTPIKTEQHASSARN